MCLGPGAIPMPVALDWAECGPSLVGTARPENMDDLPGMNPCPSYQCVSFLFLCFQVGVKRTNLVPGSVKQTVVSILLGVLASLSMGAFRIVSVIKTTREKMQDETWQSVCLVRYGLKFLCGSSHTGFQANSTSSSLFQFKAYIQVFL